MEVARLEDIHHTQVEFPYMRADIQIFRDKAYSCLHLISEEDFREGIARMERDLMMIGPIPCVARYVLVWGTARS